MGGVRRQINHSSEGTWSRSWRPTAFAVIALVLACGGLTVAQIAESPSAGATSGPPTVLDVGHAAYALNASSTTIATTSNGLALPQATITVASTSGFDSSYVSLTIVTSSGTQSVFCAGGDTSTTFTKCSGGVGTLSTGSLVTSAAVTSFDIDTLITGGASAVDGSSLTVLTDVPQADRGIPSTAIPATSTAVIDFLASSSATGTFSLTFGICATGISVYANSDVSCTTGSIDYAPAVSQPLGDTMSIDGGAVAYYQSFLTAVYAPSTATSGADVTNYVAPAPEFVPAFSPAGSLGAATVIHVSAISVIYPVPSGMTVQSISLQGGDATSSDTATASLCTTASSTCTATTGTNYADTSTPYIELSLPAATTIAGGAAFQLPTLVVSLLATGALGTAATWTMSELKFSLSGSVVVVDNTVDFTGTFNGYPTSSSSGSPILAAAQALALSTIEGVQSVSIGTTQPSAATVGGATYSPTADATSGLTPTITVDAAASTVCSITSGVVSFIGVGTCVLDANQAGNSDYLPANQFQQSFAVGQGTTTTTLKVGSSSVPYGHEQTEKLSVTVSPASGPTEPTGSVTLTSGVSHVCVVNLVAGAGSCDMSSTQFTSGDLTVVATYGGDLNFVSSSTSEPVMVTKATSKTALRLSAPKSTIGHEQTVKLSVKVTPEFAGVVTGTVTVKSGSKKVCVIKLASSGGSCRLSATALKTGTFKLHASYGGSSDFLSSNSSNVSLVVST